MDARAGPRFTVTRTTVVRVEGGIDDAGVVLLGRMLADLVDDQGITDLVIDLSEVVDPAPGLAAVLERARCRIDELGGLLEVRTPHELPSELAGLASNIPMFASLDTDKA